MSRTDAQNGLDFHFNLNLDPNHNLNLNPNLNLDPNTNPNSILIQILSLNLIL
jgi:hypothetical protein